MLIYMLKKLFYTSYHLCQGGEAARQRLHHLKLVAVIHPDIGIAGPQQHTLHPAVPYPHISWSTRGHLAWFSFPHISWSARGHLQYSSMSHFPYISWSTRGGHSSMIHFSKNSFKTFYLFFYLLNIRAGHATFCFILLTTTTRQRNRASGRIFVWKMC